MTTSKRIKTEATNGNYIGYYNKRKLNENGKDSRLELIPLSWLEGKLVLDCGCNIGLTTLEVAKYHNVRNIQGVDLDANLIKNANKQIHMAWSKEKPSKRLLDAAAVNQIRKDPTIRDLPPHQLPPPPPPATTIVESTPSSSNLNYFPIALPRLFGFLPLPPKELMTTNEESSTSSSRKGRGKAGSGEMSSFPLNIGFTVADWPNERIGTDRNGYDVIFALSITKWIHLNHLNAGLLRFFSKAFESLLPGGKFILEPQPFSSYSNSVRASSKLKANFELLKIEGEDRGWRDEEGDFERVLLGIGFERKENLRVRGEGGFERPVDVYYKGLYGVEA